MSQTDDQHLDENEQDSTLDKTRETDDQDNFDDIFENDTEIGEDEEAPVTREEYNRLVKGVKKLASQNGRKKEEVKPVVESTDDITDMFFTTNPKAELVKDKLEKVAKSMYNGSVIKAWRNEEWLRDLADAEGERTGYEEQSRSKIDRPSPGKAGGLSFANVDLTNKDHVKWLNAKPGRRSEYSQWYASNR